MESYRRLAVHLLGASIAAKEFANVASHGVQEIGSKVMPIRPAALALLTNFLIPDCIALRRLKNVMPTACMIIFGRTYTHRTLATAKPTRCDFSVCGV